MHTNSQLSTIFWFQELFAQDYTGIQVPNKNAFRKLSFTRSNITVLWTMQTALKFLFVCLTIIHFFHQNFVITFLFHLSAFVLYSCAMLVDKKTFQWHELPTFGWPKKTFQWHMNYRPSGDLDKQTLIRQKTIIDNVCVSHVHHNNKCNTKLRTQSHILNSISLLICIHSSCWTYKLKP